MEVIHLIAYTLCGAVILAYLIVKRRNSHWKDRGIPHEEPAFFYGNMKCVGRTKTFFEPIREVYRKYKGTAPFVGFYLFLRPVALVLDLELIKSILIKDFNNFSARGNYNNERDDSLSANLVNLDGPKWKRIRSKLTPTFTSGKMRFMFPTVVEVGERFADVLGDVVRHNNSEVEVKDLLARFTTDVIGCCAFGIECNSLRDPSTEFRRMGSRIFAERGHNALVNALSQAFPDVARKLRVTRFPRDIIDFYTRVVRDNVDYRERNGIVRNDFMNLLIELKNNKNDDDLNGLSIEEVTAQAFVFFAAGFETSSSTMSFCLYELALNPQVQEKLRSVIREALKKNDDILTYDCLSEMKYLDQVFCETLRKYSIVPAVLRITQNEYTIANSDYILEAGTPVLIPSDAIHHDPDIYPDPELFDPERFTPNEVQKRHPVTWLPFGDGPRNCIGMRFGRMEALIGLVMLLKNFKFSPSAQTKIPLQFNLKSSMLNARDGLVLKVETL